MRMDRRESNKQKINYPAARNIIFVAYFNQIKKGNKKEFRKKKEKSEKENSFSNHTMTRSHGLDFFYIT